MVEVVQVDTTFLNGLLPLLLRPVWDVSLILIPDLLLDSSSGPPPQDLDSEHLILLKKLGELGSDVFNNLFHF